MTKCKQCGVMFQALNGGFRYCDACGNAYLPRPCARCGKAFVSRERGRQFCSQSCGAQRADIWSAFTSYVGIPRDARGCSVWKGGLRGNPWQRNNMYGEVNFQGRRTSAHRFAWEQAHGPISKGLIVRHKCDNPLCVHVEHLELGTHRDNTRDIIVRGRWPKRLHKRALSAGQVALARKWKISGETRDRIAERLGVSPTTVHRALTGGGKTRTTYREHARG